jgi:hypothetical protein
MTSVAWIERDFSPEQTLLRRHTNDILTSELSQFISLNFRKLQPSEGSVVTGVPAAGSATSVTNS